MEPDHEERRLTTILSADVVGYSRLMAADEAGTVAQLKTHRKELLDPKTTEYHGRVVKLMGDGALMEFGSVVDAVLFAVVVQRAMAERNASVPEDRQITYRVGINIGDIIVDGDDIYGDGVNVAARLEGLAEPGGICISRTVFNHVKNKVELSFEDLGDQEVKNIPEPVRVFRVLIDPETAGVVRIKAKTAKVSWRRSALAAAAVLLFAAAGLVIWQRPWEPREEPASIERMAFPLPEKPSIAVLPFDNLSGDPGQEPIADGITENIIAALSTVPHLFVIARNSVFTYKGSPVQVRRVAEEQGVRYVLEGSVQRFGDRLRITAQLIDAITGSHLWSERYDRDVKDMFALQDEITLKIVEALQVKLTEGEQARIARKGTDNLEAWLLRNQSRRLFLRFTKEDNVRSRELAQKAVDLDPEYAGAYIRLGWTHWIDAQAGWGKSRADSLRRAVEMAQVAENLDDANPKSFALLGVIHLILRQHDQALAYMEKAIELGPNDSGSIALLAFVLNYAGQPGKALTLLPKAMRLSPYYEDWYLGELGRAYLLTGQYDEAIEALKQRLRRNPESGEAHVLLAAAYGKLGRENEAQAALAEFLKPRPYYTLRHYAQGEFYKNTEDLERVLDGLRKAGLPE
ncbi:MAG: tetratricopeptide repeat protein [Nitrospirota bacterium]|nr:tetratricopeptide repeat protein [Nitrospirota bacterium]